MIESEKDILLLKSIAKTGLITDDLLYLLGITKNRLQQHIISNNIKNVGHFLIYGTMKKVYILSSYCKRRMMSEFLITPYKTDFTQLEHDYVLTKIYLFLKAKEKESWIPESMLIERYPSSPKTSDAVYTSLKTNRVIGVEVITKSYTKYEIREKCDFINKYCDDKLIIHTHKKWL